LHELCHERRWPKALKCEAFPQKALKNWWKSSQIQYAAVQSKLAAEARPANGRKGNRPLGRARRSKSLLKPGLLDPMKGYRHGTVSAFLETMKTNYTYIPGRDDDDVPDYLTAD
jgi:hypothetical protein